VLSPIYLNPDGTPYCHACYQSATDDLNCANCGKAHRGLFSAKPLCGKCRPKPICTCCQSPINSIGRVLPTGLVCTVCEKQFEFTVTEEEILQEFEKSAHLIAVACYRDAVKALLIATSETDPMLAARRLAVWIRSATAFSLFFPAPSEIQALVIIDRLGETGLLKHQELLEQLVKAGHFPRVTEAHREFAKLRPRLVAIVESCQASWATPHMREYVDTLVMRARLSLQPSGALLRKPIQPVSAVAFMNAIKCFVEFAHGLKIRNIKNVSQMHLEAFHSANLGYNHLTGAITDFWKTCPGARRLEPRRQPKRPPRALPEANRTKLLKTWLAAEGKDCRFAFLGLMAGLYRGQLSDLCAMKLDDIERVGDETRLNYGRCKVLVHPRVIAVLDRWLACRATLLHHQNSAYLFPSRTRMGHIASLSACQQLAKQSVRIDELHASGLKAAFLFSNALPKTITQEWGVPSTTVHDHYSASNPHVRDGLDTVVAKSRSKAA
jgi:integrase